MGKENKKERFKLSTGWLWAQASLAALGGFIGWYLGGVDSFLYALAAFVAADYLTGVVAAMHGRGLSSGIGARGILRKAAIFMLVGVAHIVDAHVIGRVGVLRTMIIFFYLSNEGISILENAASIGLPVPLRLKDALGKLYEEKEGEKGREQAAPDEGWALAQQHEDMSGGDEDELAD